MSVSEQRRAELAERLGAVRARISAEVNRLGRREPELIVVTKFHPAQDVQALFELGVRQVGENRDQEAAAKAQELGLADLNWHFIGQLQSNKARSVLSYASAIHSVDRPGLISALGKALQQRSAQGQPSHEVDAFIQLNLDPEAEAGAGAGANPRGGAAPSAMLDLAQQVALTPGLRLRGIMAVAPLGEEPARAFDRLAGHAARLRAEHPAACDISAGMSHDLEQALAIGATHLRIGTDVLGPRPPMR